MAYCSKDDLLTGDIPLAGKYGDGTGFVNLARDEIDAQIGHIYVTPVAFPTPEVPEHRPAKLLLKKINQLLASGRIVLDMAAGGEDDNLHAYGASMVREALGLLNQIVKGDIKLFGASEVERVADDGDNGPLIALEDSYSMVEAFYTRNPPILTPGRPVPIYPYAGP